MLTTKFSSFVFNIHTIQHISNHNLTIRTYFILNMPYKLGDTPEGRYKPCLVKLMNFIYDNPDPPFTTDTTFTTDQLNQITPSNVVSFFKWKAYGSATPSANADPIHARASSLYNWKKQISWFMPNKGMAWDYQVTRGNPTKSHEVNDLIKEVKKKETRRQGAPPKKRRPMEAAEFEKLIEMLENFGGKLGYFTSCYFRYQLSMIARLDDTAKLRLDTILPSIICRDFAITSALVWSKNVVTEEQCPQQILLGAMDPRYCVLIGMATWLEYALETGELHTFAFEIDGMKAPKNIKDRASRFLNKIIKSQDFMAIIEEFIIGPLGSHSIRKFATTFARRAGQIRDNVNYRARWKHGKRRMQQDDYCDVDLPLPDAKVCQALCKGGAVGYKVRQGAGISDDWILDYVVPGIAAKLPRLVAIVLGKALLWRVFHDHDQFLPGFICDRVKKAYRDIGTRRELDENESPVEKVPLIVYGDATNSKLIIEEAHNRSGSVNSEGERGGNAGFVQEELQFVNAQCFALRRDNQQLQAQLDRLHAMLSRQLGTINRNVRVGFETMQNGRNGGLGAGDNGMMMAFNEGTANEMNYTATLVPRPKDVHTLWQEYYVFGILLSAF